MLSRRECLLILLPTLSYPDALDSTPQSLTTTTMALTSQQTLRTTFSRKPLFFDICILNPPR